MVAIHKVRQAGLVGLLGGAILAVYGIPDALDPGTFSGTGATAVLYGQVLMVPLVLLLVGLVGLYWLHEDAFGPLGRWSATTVALGLALMIASAFYGYVVTGGTFELLGVEDGAFIVLILSFFVLVLIGSIPLGYATLRAGVLPRRGPWALMLAAPVGFAVFAVLAGVLQWGGPFVGVTAPYGVAWIIVGNDLWSRPGTAEARTVGR